MRQERYCRWCEQEATRLEPSWFGGYADLGDESVHYVEAGSGPPVLFVHGLLAWSFTWRKNLSYISEHAHVFAPDLRGFGLTTRSKEGFSLEEQADLLLRFMDALSIQRAVICGHSMGGEIALRLAMRAPDRVQALILVASSGYVVKGEVAGEKLLHRWPWLSAAIARFLFLNRRFARQALQAAYCDSNTLCNADVEGYFLPARAPGAAQAFVRMLKVLDFGASTSRYPSVRHPALLIWGDQDPWVPVSHGQRLARDLPGAELVTFAACGHCPHEEYPAKFNRLVASFLGRLRDTGGPAADH